MLLDHANTLNLTVQDIAAKRIAVLGASGSGKTNTVARLVEQLLPSMPVTIIDPHEDYWGLREKFPILIAGRGLHTDIALSPESAPALADYSFGKRLPVILGMLLMTEDERTEIVVRYSEALWQAAIRAETRLPYEVVIDEAHNFIPEGGKQTAAAKRMKQFAMEGRKFGIGMILSTQRSAAISKDVLGQCEMYLLHGVSIKQDVDAYSSVLPYDPAETKRIAYDLVTGEVLFRQGRRVERARILKRDTFHAGDTPTLDAAPAPQLQAIDAALLESLSALLKAPNAAPTSAASAPIVDPAMSESLAAERAENERLRAKNLRLEMDVREAQGQVKRLREDVERLQARINKFKAKPELPPVQEQLLAVGERHDATTTIKRTTTTIEEVTQHVSTRALKMRVNKQTSAFNDFMTKKVGALTSLQRNILLALVGDTEAQWSVGKLARTLDCSEDTAKRYGRELCGTGLVTRIDTWVFQANVTQYLSEWFPDLDTDRLFDRVVRALEN